MELQSLTANFGPRSEAAGGDAAGVTGAARHAGHCRGGHGPHSLEEQLQASTTAPATSTPASAPNDPTAANLGCGSTPVGTNSGLGEKLQELSNAALNMLTTLFNKLTELLNAPGAITTSGSSSSASTTPSSSTAAPGGSSTASSSSGSATSTTSTTTTPGTSTSGTSTSGTGTTTPSTGTGTTAPGSSGTTSASNSGTNSTGTTSASGATGSLSFADKEKEVLKTDSKGKVSEIELRRGVVVYQLYQKDSKLADSFQTLYNTAIQNKSTPTVAVKTALNQLVKDGKLSKADANWVYSLSFRAAQFEGSQQALSTSTTGTHGLDRAAAIKIAEATLAGIQSGTVSVKPISV